LSYNGASNQKEEDFFVALIAKKYYGELVDLHHYGHIVVTDETGKIL